LATHPYPPTFAGEINNRFAMDKADFTFIVASFLYMVLAIVDPFRRICNPTALRRGFIIPSLIK